MTEATRQAQLAAVLAPLFAEGSVLVNDYRTPQVSSRELAPWAIIAVADELTALPGEAWSTPAARYGVYVNLLDYRRGRSDKALLDAFQALRTAVIGALIATPYLANRIESGTALGPYFSEDGEIDPDSIAQRLIIEVTDYEVN